MSLPRSLFRFLVVALFLLTLSRASNAQITALGDDTSTPIPGVGHDYIHFLDETVNPANGSVSLRIQVPMPKGRGITIPFGFNYDSNGVIHLVGSGAGFTNWVSDPSYLSQGGWSYAVPLLNSVGYNITYGALPQPTWTCFYQTGFLFQDPSGGRHPLRVGSASIVFGNGVDLCNVSVPNGGDELTTAALNFTGSILNSATLLDHSGTTYYFPSPSTSSLPSYIEDRNGNKLNIVDKGSGVFTLNDTVGRPVISSSGFGPSGTTNNVSVSGLPLPYQITWQTIPAKYSVPFTEINNPPTPGECSGLEGINTTLVVIKSISLPNGQKYQFQYDPVYGLLSQITYPSGAWVKYTWNTNPYYSQFIAYQGKSGGVDCYAEYGPPSIATRQISFDGSTVAQTQVFTYTTNWSNLGWSSKVTQVATADNVLNKTAQTNYTYGSALSLNGNNDPFTNPNSLAAAQIPIETSVAYYDWGNSSKLRTVNKTWYELYAIKSQETVLEDAKTSSTVSYCYVGSNCMPNIPIQLQNKSESDFGGTILRNTTYTYQAFTNTPGQINDRPCKVVTSDGGGNAVAETDYLYDGGTTLCGTPGSAVTTAVANLPSGTHDETLFSASSATQRGNVTQVTNKCLQSCSDAVTKITYDETGQVISKTDPCGTATCSDMTGTNHTTIYSYKDNYDSPPSANTNTYLTSVTDPLGHTSSYEYAYLDGQLIQATDQNGQVTNYSYADPLRRLTKTQLPADPNNSNMRETSSYTYNDTPPTPSVTTTQLMNTSNQNITTTTTMDGMGHTIETLLTSDPDCASGDRTDTTYDGFGRVYTVSNPYCSTSDPTYGLTTYAYDGIGRTLKVTHPDNTSIQTSYGLRDTKVQDEGNGNGSQNVTRISQVDGLGRLTTLCEVASPPFVASGGASANSLVGQNGTPGSCNIDMSPTTGFATSYSYNTLDDLTTVTQGTMASRTFAYDSLSRLTSSYNPESGTITYAYDANGNLSSKTAPAPNQTGSATVTTSYTYDVLNRSTQKSYSDGGTPVPTPTVSFVYDLATSPAYGVTISNPIGRLIQATGAANGCAITINSYDPLGRITNQYQQTPVTCANKSAPIYRVPYYYDLAGHMTSSSNGYFNAYTYGYNTAGRLTTVNSSLIDSQHPGSLVSASHYNAFGAITSDTLGDGETQSLTYDKRLRLQSATSTYNSTTVYSYSLGFAPDSNVISANDSVNGNWTYTYDQMNRLVGSNQNSGASIYSYVYDRFGNRWQQNGAYSFIATFTGNNPANPANNNRIDSSAGYTYDAAGNVHVDPRHTYYYDAENRLIQVDGTLGNCTTATACYVYDAFGHRVRRFGFTGDTCDSTGIRDYVYNLSGNWVVEVNSAGTQCNYEVVYAGSRHVVSYVNGGTLFAHPDWLGTERLRVNYNAPGNSSSYIRCTSLPFGDALSCNNDPSTLHFTGKERDAESGLDNFLARYDSSTAGRFISPDSANTAGDLLEWESPQSWNAYSYVKDDPIDAADPDGHDCVFVQNNTVWVARGDCTGISNGIYVPGTVNEKSGTYDQSTGTVGFNYTPDSGGIGKGNLSGVYPSGGVSDTDRVNAVAQGTQLAEKNIRVGAIFMAENAAAEVGGGLIAAGVEALLASRVASPTLKVVINWAHRIQDVRPGHLPPPGTQQEIQQAVEAAVKARSYTTDAHGVINGTTVIQGVEVGFRGKIIGNDVRVATVFTKR